MNRSSSHAVEIRLGTSLSKKSEGESEGEIPPRGFLRKWPGSRFPVTTKDRSERAQCQAKKTGKIEEKVASRTKYTTERRKSVPSFTICGGKSQWCLQKVRTLLCLSYACSVYNAWQISPICRMLAVGAFVLDGTKRFYDKNQGRIVLEDAKEISPPELHRNNGRRWTHEGVAMLQKVSLVR